MITHVEVGAEKLGGLGKLAAALGIKHQAFYSWSRVPPGRVLDFERVTGISRHVLRPDIYGPPIEEARQGQWDGAGPPGSVP